MSTATETPSAVRGALLYLLPAALLAGAWLLLHLLGWREHTSVLSGTVPGEGGSPLQGVLYVLAWFGAVVAAPIVALQGVVRAGLWRWLGPTTPRTSEEARTLRRSR